MNKTLSILTLSLALGACGAKQPGNKDAYQTNSANCSSSFVSEYNSLGESAKEFGAKADAGTATIEDVNALRAQLVAFKDKYADVACKAEVGGKEETIDVNAQMDKLIKIIDDAKKEAGIENIVSEASEIVSAE
jgi:hypothetical protein